MDTIALCQDFGRLAELYDYKQLHSSSGIARPVLSSSKTAEQLTLAEAVELIVYGASCNRCHETRRIDLAQLRDRLAPRTRVGDIRPRLRCSKCGTRKVIAVTLWTSATVNGSVVGALEVGRETHRP